MAIRLAGTNHELAAAVVLLAVGLGCAVYAGEELWASSGSRSWTRTEGTVDECQIHRDRGSWSGVNPKGTYARHSSHAKSSTVTVRVHYTYRADGVSRRSSRIGWPENRTFNDRESAEAFAARFPRDGAVTVYFDPGRPSMAVLEPGLAWSSMPLFLFGCLTLAGGIWMTRHWHQAAQERIGVSPSGRDRTHPDPGWSPGESPWV